MKILFYIALLFVLAGAIIDLIRNKRQKRPLKKTTYKLKITKLNNEQ